MRKVKYLHLPRDGNFRLRRLVPPDLQKILRQTEISINLETKDPKEAERRLWEKLIEVDELFERARNGTLVNYDLRDACDVIEEWLLEEVDHWKPSSAAWQSPPFKNDEHTRTSIEKYISKWEIELTPRVKAYALEHAPAAYFRYEHRRELKRAMPSVLEIFGAGKHDSFEKELYEWGIGEEVRFLLEEGAIPSKSPAIPADQVPHPTLATATNSEPLNERSQTRLSIVFKDFLRDSQMGISSRNEWTLCWRRLVEFTGDISISDLRADHIREWHRLYRRCPKRLPNNIREKSLREIVDFAERNYGQYDPVSRATAQKYLTCVKSVLNWAVDEGYIAASPAAMVKAPKVKSTNPEERRLPLSTDDLNLTFSSPVYTGYRSSHKRHVPGDIITKDALYWMPVLALLTGARLEELGQLRLSDIREEHGIPYIDINDDGDKKVKNKYSIRRVPIHPELVRVGFLNYVASLRQDGEQRLFPEFKRDKRDSFTQRFSTKSNRYLDRIGITDPRKVYHSFRHTFKDAARKAKLEKAMRDKLQGHAHHDVAEDYGIGWDFQDLYEAICKISYAGVNLDALVTA
jgi:integrase